MFKQPIANGLPRHIALIGFMGAGKTTIGCMLANKLGLRFIDTDTLIEEVASTSISNIFAVQGESTFRKIEAQVVQEAAISQEPAVIATGGGAVANQDTMRALNANALVIWLDAPLAVMLDRASRQGQRPLLANEQDGQRLQVLYNERLPIYAQAHAVISSVCVTSAVAQVSHLWENLSQSGGYQTISVNTVQRRYQIHVGSGLLPLLPSLIPLPIGRALVVSDSNVAPLYGKQVLGALRAAGWHAEIAIFPAGEESKTAKHLYDLYKACARERLDRQSLIVAVGGGVTGDLAGYAAATWLRGIPLVQVPTSLLAQVDASVGGKVAIDLPEGKNLVGSFYQPWLVVADMNTLISLPKRQLVSGLAEVVKHGLIADASLFSYIEENLPDILAGKPQVLAWCVQRSCEIKSAVVSADERESNVREVLNFGHTVGHAIETVTGYKSWTHGEAVAAGMVLAAQLSTKIGLPYEIVERLVNLLKRAGLPVAAPGLISQDLLEVIGRDKKVQATQPRFVLLSKLGKAHSAQPVDQAHLHRLLANLVDE